MGTPDGLEIERTWLLASAPSADDLEALDASPIMIEQVYLTQGTEAGRRRIRRLDGPDGVTFVLTEKAGHGVTREERERAIDGATYQALLAEADPTRRPIRKVRHRIPHGGHTIELDVFADPPGLVLLEVEISAPADKIDPWPEAIAPLVMREVTDDRSYENAELALAEQRG
jgi:adenylate cyclase